MIHFFFVFKKLSHLLIEKSCVLRRVYTAREIRVPNEIGIPRYRLLLEYERLNNDPSTEARHIECSKLNTASRHCILYSIVSVRGNRSDRLRYGVSRYVQAKCDDDSCLKSNTEHIFHTRLVFF